MSIVTLWTWDLECTLKYRIQMKTGRHVLEEDSRERTLLGRTYG
jgi:hypothetical protein